MKPSKIKRVLVIGAGRFGSAITKRLFELDVKVVVVDKNEKRIEDVRKWAADVFVLDATDKDAIEEIASYGFDAACIAVGENFSLSLLLVVYLKNRGIPYVVGRASDEVQAKILKLIGCDLIMLPEEYMGKDLAEELVLGERKMFDLSKQFVIAEALAEPYYWGKSLGSIDFESMNLILCALKKSFRTKKGLDFNFVPPTKTDTIVEEGDYFIVLGEKKKVIRFLKGE